MEKEIKCWILVLVDMMVAFGLTVWLLAPNNKTEYASATVLFFIIFVCLVFVSCNYTVRNFLKFLMKSFLSK